MNKDGEVTMEELGFYLRQNFEKETEKYRSDPQGAVIQTPPPMVSLGRDANSARVNDFPLVSAR